MPLVDCVYAGALPCMHLLQASCALCFWGTTSLSEGSQSACLQACDILSLISHAAGMTVLHCRCPTRSVCCACGALHHRWQAAKAPDYQQSMHTLRNVSCLTAHAAAWLYCRCPVCCDCGPLHQSGQSPCPPTEHACIAQRLMFDCTRCCLAVLQVSCVLCFWGTTSLWEGSRSPCLPTEQEHS
jgi:hypothetical protein